MNEGGDFEKDQQGITQNLDSHRANIFRHTQTGNDRGGRPGSACQAQED